MPDVFIHPGAHASQEARIGQGAKIWVNAQIRENVTAGEHCIISKDTCLDEGVSVGSVDAASAHTPWWGPAA